MDIKNPGHTVLSVPALDFFFFRLLFINFLFRIPLAAAPRVSFLSRNRRPCREGREIRSDQRIPAGPGGRHPHGVQKSSGSASPGAAADGDRVKFRYALGYGFEDRGALRAVCRCIRRIFNVASGINRSILCRTRRAYAEFRIRHIRNFRAARACFTSSCFISVPISCFISSIPFPVSPYFFFLISDLPGSESAVPRWLPESHLPYRA